MQNICNSTTEPVSLAPADARNAAQESAQNVTKDIKYQLTKPSASSPALFPAGLVLTTNPLFALDATGALSRMEPHAARIWPAILTTLAPIADRVQATFWWEPIARNVQSSQTASSAVRPTWQLAPSATQAIGFKQPLAPSALLPA